MSLGAHNQPSTWYQSNIRPLFILDRPRVRKGYRVENQLHSYFIVHLLCQLHLHQILYTMRHGSRCQATLLFTVNILPCVLQLAWLPVSATGQVFHRALLELDRQICKPAGCLATSAETTRLVKPSQGVWTRVDTHAVPLARECRFASESLAARHRA